MDLLFGSILGVRSSDLWLIVAVAVLASTLLLALWGRLGYATFDDELARADGLNTDRLELLLFLVAAVIIAVSASVVGVILMAAYLVIPAAAARLLARTLAQMTVLAVVLGLVSTVVGLAVSFYLDVQRRHHSAHASGSVPAGGSVRSALSTPVPSLRLRAAKVRSASRSALAAGSRAPGSAHARELTREVQVAHGYLHDAAGRRLSYGQARNEAGRQPALMAATTAATP